MHYGVVQKIMQSRMGGRGLSKWLRYVMNVGAVHLDYQLCRFDHNFRFFQLPNFHWEQDCTEERFLFVGRAEWLYGGGEGCVIHLRSLTVTVTIDVTFWYIWNAFSNYSICKSWALRNNFQLRFWHDFQIFLYFFFLHLENFDSFSCTWVGWVSGEIQLINVGPFSTLLSNVF